MSDAAQTRTPTKPRHARTVLPLLGVLFGMSMLVYYAVPLYQLFCRVTGYGGTTQRAAQAPGAVGKRTFVVRFNADTNANLPWSFQPASPEVTLRVGEERLAYYRAKNRAARAVTGTATFNVTPQKAGMYFVKVDCFCFRKQRLEPGRSIDMPVSFYIDPAILKDPNLRDVRTITLSYTFYRAREDKPRAAAKSERLKTN